MQLLTPIYKLEVEWLHNLQNHAIFDDSLETFWLSITKIGDPSWAFFVYFPLLLPLIGPPAFKFLLAACLSEYANGILKWLMHGERPYWYVQENAGFAHLKQFKWTCETGPGSPSGHVMGSAAVFWVLVKTFSVGKDRGRKIAIHSIFGIFIGLVAISRLYIAAHFPHQVIFGVFAGIFIGQLVNRSSPEDWSLQRWLFLTASMSFVCKFVHDGLIHFGFDPAWSIAKALKYCINAEWVHISTTPVASFFRDLSSVYTLGFVIQNSPIHSQQFDNQAFIIKFIYCIISLISSQVISKLPQPQYEDMHFYWITSLCNVLNILVVGYCIPYCAVRHNQIKYKNG